jgi:hypothetical protein
LRSSRRSSRRLDSGAPRGRSASTILVSFIPSWIVGGANLEFVPAFEFSEDVRQKHSKSFSVSGKGRQKSLHLPEARQ